MGAVVFGIEMENEVVFEVHETAEQEKLRGNELFARGLYAEAIQHYNTAIEYEPQNVIYRNNRAAALLKLERFEDAIFDCRQVILLDSKCTKAHLRMAAAMVALGRLGEAIFVYRLVLSMCADTAAPDNMTQQRQEIINCLKKTEQMEKDLNQAKECLSNRDFKTARDNFSALLSNCRGSIDLKILLSEAHIGLKDLKQANDQIMPILRQFPHSPTAIYVKGLHLLYSSSNPEKAICCFRAALRIDPDFEKCSITLKRVYTLEKLKSEGNQAYDRAEFANAHKHYTDALGLDPNYDKLNAILFNNRAAASIKLNNFDDALQDCAKAIALDSQYLKAHLRQASIYLHLQHYDEALNSYQAALQLDPSNKEILYGIKTARNLQKQEQKKDYYKLLEIPYDADQADIKKAYRTMVLRWHPDKNSGNTVRAEVIFKAVQAAYDVLSDPEKRQEYDLMHNFNNAFSFSSSSRDFSYGWYSSRGYSGFTRSEENNHRRQQHKA